MCINKPPNVHPINSGNPIVVTGEGGGGRYHMADQTSECPIRAAPVIRPVWSHHGILMPGPDTSWLIKTPSILHEQHLPCSDISDDGTCRDKRINVSSWSFDSKTMVARIRRM